MEVQSQNLQPRTAIGEVGREDRNREGGYKGGKGNASTGITQRLKAGGLATKSVEAGGRGNRPGTATRGRREEGPIRGEDGKTRRRHRGGRDDKGLGAKGESGEKGELTGTQAPAATSGSRNIIMGAGDGHRDGHVVGNQGRQGSIAIGFGEGTGDVFVVP